MVHLPPHKTHLVYADTILCTYVLSVCAASAAETVTYPLDLTKTRLQIQGEILSKAGNTVTAQNVPYRGMFRTLVGIVQEEGILQLWQGISPALCRHVVYSGTRMIVYEGLRNNVFKRNPDGTFDLWKSIICGVSAGAFSQFIASPTDLVKVQMMMEGKRRLMGEKPRVNGLRDAFKTIFHQGGVRGLWKGSVPNVQRAALVNLGDLTTYDTAKHFIITHTSLEDGILAQFMSSACAGFVATVVGTPADVVKTRVMNQATDASGRGLIYASSIDCLRKTITNEGFLALYKGFFPIWVRLAPWSLTFWLSFEQLRRLVGVEQF